MRWLLKILIKMKLKIPWSCRIMLRCQRGVGWRRYFIVEGQTNFTKCNRNGKCSDYPNPDHKYLLDFDLFSVVISIQSFSQFENRWGTTQPSTGAPLTYNLATRLLLLHLQHAKSAVYFVTQIDILQSDPATCVLVLSHSQIVNIKLLWFNWVTISPLFSWMSIVRVLMPLI